jgi:hypothetical protein
VFLVKLFIHGKKGYLLTSRWRLAAQIVGGFCIAFVQIVQIGSTARQRDAALH